MNSQNSVLLAVLAPQSNVQMTTIMPIAVIDPSIEIAPFPESRIAWTMGVLTCR